MSSNTESVMCRFLFAILQQKNLKDIDWNLVAHNPILSQEISNGHAARMRYSRFKQSLLGHQPQKRNRNPNKNKITKSKKDTKPKREEDEHTNTRQQAPKTESHPAKHDAVVKTEASSFLNERLTTTSLPPASMADGQMQFQNRLLTPCSETDMFGTAHRFTESPLSELHHEQPFEYTGAIGQCAGQNSSVWHQSPYTASTYMHAYELEGYGAPAAFCGEHQHSPHPESFGIDPSAMMAPESSHVPVKQEE